MFPKLRVDTALRTGFTWNNARIPADGTLRWPAVFDSLPVRTVHVR